MTAPAIAPAVHDWRLWTVDARLVVTDPAALEQAIETCRRITEEVDELASRFRADSLVRRLELTGADQTPIPAVFSALLREALAAAELTDGDLDPTLGRAMQALGRPAASTSTHTLDDGTRLALVDPAPMWRRIRLDTTRDLLTMPAGVLIDLGATAKAQTADWCARAIAEQTGSGVLVSLGGDLATAGPGPDGGWQVHVQDLPDDPEQVVTLRPGLALATSSVQKRRWTTSGQAAHHILDPRTLTPAPLAWRSVTVAAPSATLANTLSTASLVRGRRALRLLADHGLPARLVDLDGQVTALNGWPSEASR